MYPLFLVVVFCSFPLYVMPSANNATNITRNSIPTDSTITSFAANLNSTQDALKTKRWQREPSYLDVFSSIVRSFIYLFIF